MTAAGYAAHVPVVVLHGGRVVVASTGARAEGIRLGLRRREAQARCPEVVVVTHDPDRDAREYEPVVAAVEALAPGVAVVVPGLLALRANGPARYFGGDARVAELLAAEVDVRLHRFDAPATQVGIADGLFAATLAARAQVVVPPGMSREFLASQDVSTLSLVGVAGAGPCRDELIDLLRRLGLRRLGALADLDAADVASRFGADGVLVHRLARGLDPHPLTGRLVPLDLEAEKSLDPPADRVELAAFAAREVAGQLAGRLAAHGLACTRLQVHARTEAGEEHVRTWRSDDALDADAIGDRTRWQLDGWLTGRAGARPTAGVCTLRLVAEEVTEHRGAQLTLWGGWAPADERARRGLTRVQGMLGPGAVLVPVVGGGRGPADQGQLLPWQEERRPALPAQGPWPGRLPAPHPSTVLCPPEPVLVRDGRGRPVRLDERQLLTAAPATLHRGRAELTVTGWAGPWPLDERWWDPDAARRGARLQVVAGSSALLLVGTDHQWAIEGDYT